MRSIIKWSLSAKVFVVVIAAALMFFGAREIGDTKVDTLPEFEPHDRRSPD